MMSTNFKPVLLYKDEKRISIILEGQQQAVDMVNNTIATMLDFFQTDLTDADLKKLLIEKQNSIDELITKDFQFPKASKEFNLESTGRLEAYNDLIQELQRIRSLENIEIKKGIASINKGFIKEIENVNTHFTTNEAQNLALSKFQKIINETNDLFDLGLLDRMDIAQIEKTFKFIKFDNNQFTLRTSYLLRIKNDYALAAY